MKAEDCRPVWQGRIQKVTKETLKELIFVDQGLTVYPQLPSLASSPERGSDATFKKATSISENLADDEVEEHVEDPSPAHEGKT